MPSSKIVKRFKRMVKKDDGILEYKLLYKVSSNTIMILDSKLKTRQIASMPLSVRGCTLCRNFIPPRSEYKAVELLFFDFGEDITLLNSLSFRDVLRLTRTY